MLSRLTCLLIKAPVPSTVLRRPDATGVSRTNWIHTNFVTLSPLGEEVSLNTVTKGKHGKKIFSDFCIVD